MLRTVRLRVRLSLAWFERVQSICDRLVPMYAYESVQDGRMRYTLQAPMVNHSKLIVRLTLNECSCVGRNHIYLAEKDILVDI